MRVIDSVNALLTGFFPDETAKTPQSPVTLLLDGLEGPDPWHCTFAPVGVGMNAACALASEVEADPLTRHPDADAVRAQLEDALDIQLPNLADVRHRFFVWSDIIKCRASAESGPVPPNTTLEDWKPRAENGRGGVDYERLAQLAAFEMRAGWYTRGGGALNKPSFLGARMGPLLRRLSERMERMVATQLNSGTSGDAPALCLWGGHDTTVAPLREALGIETNSTWPRFGSSVIFELYKEADGSEFFVRVLSEGKEQHLWGGVAGPLCPLEYFVAHTKCLADIGNAPARL
jgi:hypothetical protein